MPQQTIEDFVTELPRFLQEQPPAMPESPAERIEASADYLAILCKETVGGSAQYQDLKERNQLDQDQLYIRAADALLSDRDTQLDPFERSMISLSADLGVFISAGQKLDKIRDQGSLSSADFTTMTQIKLNEIIPFNHAIKRLINRFPALNATALAENLTNATSEIFSTAPAKYGDSAYEFSATVNGMRHEAAAEELLSAAGIDFDYRVSVEEDSQGNDLFVFINGNWVGLDIKASYNAEARSYQRHRRSHAVWTTLDSEDFRGPQDDTTDSVSISYETAHEHARMFQERVHQAVSGELREVHYQARQRARRHGRHAVRAAQR